MNLNKLRGLRVEKQMTQQDIADKMGISRKSYALKENGKIKFTIQEAIELSIVLGQGEINHIFFK